MTLEFQIAVECSIAFTNGHRQKLAQGLRIKVDPLSLKFEMPWIPDPIEGHIDSLEWGALRASNHIVPVQDADTPHFAADALTNQYAARRVVNTLAKRPELARAVYEILAKEVLTL